MVVGQFLMTCAPYAAQHRPGNLLKLTFYLGMKNTKFVNSANFPDGAPRAPSHFSTFCCSYSTVCTHEQRRKNATASCATEEYHKAHVLCVGTVIESAAT
jgi:hypothetical protein